MQKGYDMSQSQINDEDQWGMVPGWALRGDYFESGAQRLLYIILEDKIDSRGYCYPTVPELAHQAGCSKPTVLRNLRGLEAKGLIRRRHRIAEDGRHLPNEYYVSLDCPIERKGSVR